MTAEITTVMGQLNIEGGVWRGDAPNQVAVREPKSADTPGAGKGDLFILVEVRGQTVNREAIERQLAEAVRDTYYLARGSMTASLRRALQAAGDLLYDRNCEVDVEQRLIAGVVALVMDNDDAFVAQIGPAAFYAVLGDYIRRYPAKSVWLDEALEPEQDKHESALGISMVVEPNLHHLRVGPKDMLVLADSDLAGQLPLDDVVKAVDGREVKTALKNLGQVAQAQHCSALVLGVVERGQPAPGPLNVAKPSKFGRLFRSGDRSAAAPVMSAAAPEFVAEPEPVGAEAGPGASGSKPGGQAKDESPAFPETNYDFEPAGADGKVLASTAPEPAFDSHLYRSRPGGGLMAMARMFRSLGAGILVLIALVGNGLKSILSLGSNKSEHQPRQAGMQAQRKPGPSVPWSLLLTIAIAIPLLVAIVVGVSYLQKGRLREAEYTELVTSAQNKFEQAQSVDHNAALGLIAEAKTLLTQAEQIKADQPEIAELRVKMAEATDTLGNVQRLYYLPQLRQYTDPGTQLKQIVAQGVEVYVLDAGNDRIYHHRMDDLGEALLPDDETLLLAAKGQVVDEITVGDFLGMTWVPAGGNRQTSDLLVLNSAGLLEYHPNWGVTAATITGRESLVLPVAVSGFFGNFYVLDPQANTLLRYFPTADGYSTQPESYFPADGPVDLTGAVDFAIDGAIYVLFKDGRIGKYMSGEPVEFNVSGLDQPFSNPVSIFTAPNEEVQHIYVADAGNQRVVQLNKDGSFMRQFKPRLGETVSFADLQDIFVDEIGGRLYVLDSNNLYVANIPGE